MEDKQTEHPANLGHEEALRAVEEALQGLEYGSILISVHQGEVVGIETARKLRLKQTK